MDDAYTELFVRMAVPLPLTCSVQNLFPFSSDMEAINVFPLPWTTRARTFVGVCRWDYMQCVVKRSWVGVMKQMINIYQVGPVP